MLLEIILLGHGPRHEEFFTRQVGMVSQPMVGKDKARADQKFNGNRCRTSIGKSTPYFENGPTTPRYLSVVLNAHEVNLICAFVIKGIVVFVIDPFIALPCESDPTGKNLALT
jgi:hypothetical protein